MQASIGRTWPDRLHNRAAVEIPLTAAGRRFFADRAAARDLALFVRSRRMHQLRKEPAAAGEAGHRSRLRTGNLAHSPIRISVINPTTLRFSETSPTGRRFQVTVKNGRISSQNLKPYGSSSSALQRASHGAERVPVKDVRCHEPGADLTGGSGTPFRAPVGALAAQSACGGDAARLFRRVTSGVGCGVW